MRRGNKGTHGDGGVHLIVGAQAVTWLMPGWRHFALGLMMVTLTTLPNLS